MPGNIVEQARVAVYLDNKDADQALKELTADVNKYTEALLNAYKTGDKNALKAASQDLKKAEQQLQTFKKQTFEVSKVLNNLNGSSLKDLQRAEREITSEMGKMTRGTKEYIAANKNLGSVRGEIKNIKSEMYGASGAGNVWSKITGVFGKLGIAAGGAFAVIKAGKFIMQSTQVLSDRWDQSLSALNTSLGYVAKSISTLDFSNFFTNLREAIRVGKEYAGTLDEIGDRNRSLEIQEADAREYILARMKILRDEMSTNEQRIKAADEIIAKEEELAAKKTAINTTAYENDRKLFLVGKDISEQELENFLRNYDNLSAEIALGTQYNNLLKDEQKKKKELLAGGYNQILYNELKKVREQISGASEDQLYWARIVKETEKLSDEERTKLVASYKDMKDAENQAMENTQRVNSRRSTLLAETVREKEKAIKKEIKDDKEIEKKKQESLKKYQELLDEEYRSTASVNEKELEDSQRKWEAIIEQAMAAGEDIKELEDKREAEGKYIAHTQLLKAQDKELFDLREQQYQQDILNAGTNIDARKKLEKGYKEDLLTMQMGMLESQRALLVQFGMDTLEIDKQIAAKQAEIRGNNFDDQLTEIDLQNEVLNQYNLITLAQRKDMEIAALDELHADGTFNEEQYQAALLAIKMKYAEEYINRYSNLLNGFSSLSNALQDANLARSESRQESELEALEERFDRELSAAGDNADRRKVIEERYADERKAIEEKFGEEQKKIKKKYALVDLVINSAKIIASTAQAVAKSIAESPLTFGLPWSAINLGLGVAEETTAIAQYTKVNQLARGRYPVIGADDHRLYHADYHGPVTRSGIINQGKPVLINETGGEMVLSAPHTRKLLLNPNLYRSVMALRAPQRAEGSYPAPGATSSTFSGQQAPPTDPQLLALLQANVAMLNKLSKGIIAHVVYQEYKDAEAEMTDIENYASGL